MHTTIDYAQSSTPELDAMADIKNHIGDRYDEIAPIMAKFDNLEDFRFACWFFGIQGFPVDVWFEHLHNSEA